MTPVTLFTLLTFTSLCALICVVTGQSVRDSNSFHSFSFNVGPDGQLSGNHGNELNGIFSGTNNNRNRNTPNSRSRSGFGNRFRTSFPVVPYTGMRRRFRYVFRRWFG